jgi:hypothetical protein
MASGSLSDGWIAKGEPIHRALLDKGKGVDRELYPNGSQAASREGPKPPIESTQSDASPYDSLPLSEWCPQTIATFRKSFSPETAAFLFSLPRKSAALRDHSACTRTRCKANDTQLAEGGRYSSAHWKTCAGGTECTFLGPDSQKIRDIIESGGTPLLSVECGKDGLLKVEASEFTSISDCWASGVFRLDVQMLDFSRRCNGKKVACSV